MTTRNSDYSHSGVPLITNNDVSSTIGYVILDSNGGGTKSAIGISFGYRSSISFNTSATISFPFTYDEAPRITMGVSGVYVIGGAWVAIESYGIIRSFNTTQFVVDNYYIGDASTTPVATFINISWMAIGYVTT